MKDVLLSLIKDTNGNLSSAKFINLVVGICGCLISWKLVILGGFNETYFGLLLAYGAGVYSYGKTVDAKTPPQV